MLINVKVMQCNLIERSRNIILTICTATITVSYFNYYYDYYYYVIIIIISILLLYEHV